MIKGFEARDPVRYGTAEQAAEKRTIFGSLLLPVLFFPTGLDPNFFFPPDSTRISCLCAAFASSRDTPLPLPIPQARVIIARCATRSTPPLPGETSSPLATSSVARRPGAEAARIRLTTERREI